MISRPRSASAACVGTNFTLAGRIGGSKRAERSDAGARASFSKSGSGIYKEKMLSRGEYLGTLYDIGFDRPETHAIRKDGSMYYAFYAPHWSGKVTLRGLARRCISRH